MGALIGMVAGAFAGHAVWREWGAILGGLVGFFVGAALSGQRQRAAHRKPDGLHTEVHAAPSRPVAAASATPSRLRTATDALWAWFTGGNALTRIGVVVLFIGVVFLLRWFAEHFTLPIELRLAAVAVVGAALVGAGLRIARVRPGYGLSLQGAGAGILYLTTYAASRLYAVLPDEAAIALLIAIAMLAVWLATRADSQALAALAIAGGFLAPMLSEAHDAPLPLFASFAILNGAIFALAWRRAWRTLNALGFACTFVLGLWWGHRYYASEHFATVEPFLVLFIAYYIAIAVLEARRGPFDIRHPVDGLLLFGVPFAGFALQVALVRGFDHGAAWSAVAFALVYGALFAVLRRRTEPAMALVAKAFLALAVIFATLAIPLLLDDRWSAALWAVEAAGVYWLGLRQASAPIRLFALGVQFAAGVAFVGIGGWDSHRPFTGVAPLFANADFAGALLIALSAFATACAGDRAAATLSPRERQWTVLVFGWATLWWLAGGVLELARQLGRAEAPHAALIWVAASVAFALVLRRALRWPRLSMAGVVLLPAMGYVALRDFEAARTTLTHYGWLIWPAAWVTQGLALAAADALVALDDPVQRTPPGTTGLLRITRVVSVCALTAQVAWEASEWVGRITPAHTVWVACAAALPAIACLWLVTWLADGTRWPYVRDGDAFARGAGAPIAVMVALWFFAVNVLSPGDAAPLPYLPLVNPLDVTLILALLVLTAWARRHARLDATTLHAWLGVGVFAACNGIVLRVAYHWGGIPWRLSALMASKPLQAALTLTWTAAALVLMYVAGRRRLRALWMVGAALLAVVVAKLFLVDLGALSGLSRVVAFLGVGILLLAIGYLSPLPPADDAVPKDDAAH